LKKIKADQSKTDQMTGEGGKEIGVGGKREKQRTIPHQENK